MSVLLSMEKDDISRPLHFLSLFFCPWITRFLVVRALRKVDEGLHQSQFQFSVGVFLEVVDVLLTEDRRVVGGDETGIYSPRSLDIFPEMWPVGTWLWEGPLTKKKKKLWFD